MKKIAIYPIILLFLVTTFNPALVAEVQQQPFIPVPGITTVQQAVDAGYRVVSNGEWTKVRGENAVEGYTYLLDGEYPLEAKNGVVTKLLFRALRGEIPGKDLLGVAIYPSISPVELISSLQETGYTCKVLGEPVLEVQGGDKLYSRSYLLAYDEHRNGICFLFYFSMEGFFSPGLQGGLAYVMGIEPSAFHSIDTTLPYPFILPSTGNERDRALDLSLVLSLQNGTNYSTLAPLRGNMKETESDRWKELLSSSWSIDSREDYFSTYDDLIAGGHSKSYRESMALIDDNPDMSILQLAMLSNFNQYQCDRLFFVKATKRWLGGRSLRAWDLGRLVSVSRWAYAALYITEEEAWNAIFPIAKTIRELYHSREDFLVSYLGGRGFYGAEDPQTYMKSGADLIDRELYRWDSRIQLPWDGADESIQRGQDADVRLSDILYTITQEQVEAREVYTKLDSLTKDGRQAFGEEAYETAAGYFSDACALLDVHAYKDYRSRTYFELLYFKGLALRAAGNIEAANSIFRELVRVFPSDLELRKLLEGDVE